MKRTRTVAAPIFPTIPWPAVVIGWLDPALIQTWGMKPDQVESGLMPQVTCGLLLHEDADEIRLGQLIAYNASGWSVREYFSIHPALELWRYTMSVEEMAAIRRRGQRARRAPSR